MLRAWADFNMSQKKPYIDLLFGITYIRYPYLTTQIVGSKTLYWRTKAIVWFHSMLLISADQFVVPAFKIPLLPAPPVISVGMKQALQSFKWRKFIDWLFHDLFEIAKVL